MYRVDIIHGCSVGLMRFYPLRHYVKWAYFDICYIFSAYFIFLIHLSLSVIGRLTTPMNKS